MGMVWFFVLSVAGWAVLFSIVRLAGFKDWKFIFPVMSAYGIRLLLAAGFFFISFFNLPFVRSQHAMPGFWKFAPDTELTHVAAQGFSKEGKYSNVFQNAVETCNQEHIVWILLVSGVYKIFGAYPLNFIVLNVWLSALQVFLAIWLMREWVGEKKSLIAGWLVALWPSAIIWSTQILKDTICLTLLLGVFALFIRISATEIRGKNGFSGKTAVFFLLLFCYFVLIKIRFYTGLFILIALIFGQGYVCIKRFFGRGRLYLWPIVAAVVFSLIAAFAGRITVPAQLIFLGQKSGPVSLASPCPSTTAVVSSREPGSSLQTPSVSPKVPSVSSKVLSVSPKVPSVSSRASSTSSRTASVFCRSVRSSFKEVIINKKGIVAVKNKINEGRIRLGFIIQKYYLKIFQVRAGFSREGGNLALDVSGPFNNIFIFILYSFLTVWFAPFPWQWFTCGGQSGVFIILGGIEMCIVYFLFVFLLCGLWRFMTTAKAGSIIFIITYIFVSSFFLGMVVSNAGTLFRLRLQFLIPMLIIGSLGLYPREREKEREP